MITGALKKLAKGTAGLVGPHRWPSNTGNLLILSYHRVLPSDDSRYEAEQTGMLVTPETLRNNIHWIREHMDIVRLADWVEGGESYSRPCCALTFDDGWLDNFEYAFPILQDLQAPATIYCVPNMIRRGGDFWPGRLVQLVEAASINGIDPCQAPAFEWLPSREKLAQCKGKSLSPAVINDLIESCKQFSDAEMHKRIDNTRTVCGITSEEPRHVASAAELDLMQRSELVDIGSHTVNHTRLSTATTDEELELEISSSRQQLEDLFDTEVSSFCYPNGLAPGNAVDCVRTNYASGTTLEPGWNTREQDFAVMKRVCVHEAVASRKLIFNATLTGWFQ